VKEAIRGLGGRLQTMPLRIEKPTMIGTGNAPLLDTSIQERSPAVRTVIAEQADVPTLVAIQDKVFPQDPHELRWTLLGELLGKGHRMPVTTQQLSGWLARTDSGKKLIFFLGQH
jgi:hypothetical protein